MKKFENIGKHLGRGGLRSFDEVELSDGKGSFERYAAAKQKSLTKENFVKSGEFRITKLMQEKGLSRHDHRLVLPISYREDLNSNLLEIFYPLIGDGTNLLDLVNKTVLKVGVSYLPIDQIRTIIRDIAKSIDALSSINAVCQDVKLSNVLSGEDGDGAWLIDFNIAEFYDDNTIDRRNFFHLLQVLLVGREIDRFFEENEPICSKEYFIQGLRTLSNRGVLDGIPDKDGTIKKMMMEHFPKVQKIIEKYWEDKDLPLKDFIKELESSFDN